MINLNDSSINPGYLGNRQNGMGGRLSFTSATPVTLADVIGATTIYYVPHVGSSILLWNGSNFISRSFTEISLTLGTLANNTNYDVFVYDNAGVLTLEAIAWTNDTTRATPFTRQGGILIKFPDNRTYLGTFRTTSTTTTEDSRSKRFLWNLYNRVNRELYKPYANATWTYTSTAVRQANGNTANQLELVCGQVENAISLAFSLFASGGNTQAMAWSIGEDSTVSPHADADVAILSAASATTATLITLPSSIGYHKYCALEALFSGSGTQTMQASVAGTSVSSAYRMRGECFA
jgi:hypothetical protein